MRHVEHHLIKIEKNLEESLVRWLPLIFLFLLAYIEISLFIAVASVLGVAFTLLLVVLTSCLGVSLVRNQGLKTLGLIQQKLAAGESPAAEMVKSVSLLIAGFLLLLPGFFTDFLGLLLLLPAVQKRLTLKLLPYISLYTPAQPRAGQQNPGGGHTIEGEYQRKDDE